MSASEESLAEELITYTVTDRIAYITLNRPAKLNALNKVMREGLFESFARFNEDRNAWVAVLRAEGRAFCAGADLREMADNGTAVPDPMFTPHLGVNIEVSKPVIASVNGPALAGGFMLAQMCDLCIAADEATFAITEAKRGRGAPWSAPLLWMIPQRVMLELLLTAEPITAQRAYEVGLVNRVVPLADLPKATHTLAQTIAANAPLSVAAGKRMTYLAADIGRSAGLEAGRLAFEHAYRSADAQEGPRAFKEGRPPVWAGE
jgi:enoyl-CoA hydratase/carnithine racemase